MVTPATDPFPERQREPVLTRHAIARMLERSVSLADLRAALRAPFVVQRPSTGGCIRVVAPALRGSRREWLVVVLTEDARVVMTVYWHSRRAAAELRDPHKRLTETGEAHHDAA